MTPSDWRAHTTTDRVKRFTVMSLCIFVAIFFLLCPFSVSAFVPYSSTVSSISCHCLPTLLEPATLAYSATVYYSLNGIANPSGARLIVELRDADRSYAFFERSVSPSSWTSMNASFNGAPYLVNLPLPIAPGSQQEQILVSSVAPTDLLAADTRIPVSISLYDLVRAGSLGLSWSCRLAAFAADSPTIANDTRPVNVTAAGPIIIETFHPNFTHNEYLSSLSAISRSSSWRDTVAPGSYIFIGVGPTVVQGWITPRPSPVVEALLMPFERLLLSTRDVAGRDRYQYRVWVAARAEDAAYKEKCKGTGPVDCPDWIECDSSSVSLLASLGVSSSLSSFLPAFKADLGYDITTDFSPYNYYSLTQSQQWHALPLTATSLYLHFNRTTYSRLGLKYPPPHANWINFDGSTSWTWETVAEHAQAIRRAGLGYGFAFYDDPNNFIPYLLLRDGARVVHDDSRRCAFNGSRVLRSLARGLGRMYTVDKSADPNIYTGDYSPPACAAPLCSPLPASRQPPRDAAGKYAFAGLLLAPGYSFDEPSHYYDYSLNPSGSVAIGQLPGLLAHLGGSSIALAASGGQRAAAVEFFKLLIHPRRPYMTALAQAANALPPYLSSLARPPFNAWPYTQPRQLLKSAAPVNYPGNAWPAHAKYRQLKPFQYLFTDWLVASTMNSSLYWNSSFPLVNLSDPSAAASSAVARACSLVDEIFKPLCTRAMIVAAADADCHASGPQEAAMKRYVVYSWSQPCEAGGLALPKQEEIDCDFIPLLSPTGRALLAIQSLSLLSSLLIALLPLLLMLAPLARRFHRFKRSLESFHSPFQPLAIAGYFLLLALAFLNLGQLSASSCRYRFYLFLSGFLLVFAGQALDSLLLAKTLAFLLFSAKRYKRLLVLAAAAIIAVNLSLAGAYAATADGGSSIQSTQRATDAGYQVKSNYCDNGKSEAWFLWSVFAFNSLWLVPSCAILGPLWRRCKLAGASLAEGVGSSMGESFSLSRSQATKARLLHSYYDKVSYIFYSSIGSFVILVLFILLAYLSPLASSGSSSSLYLGENILIIVASLCFSPVGLGGALRAAMMARRNKEKSGKKNKANKRKYAKKSAAAVEDEPHEANQRPAMLRVISSSQSDSVGRTSSFSGSAVSFDSHGSAPTAEALNSFHLSINDPVIFFHLTQYAKHCLDDENTDFLLSLSSFLSLLSLDERLATRALGGLKLPSHRVKQVVEEKNKQQDNGHSLVTAINRGAAGASPSASPNGSPRASHSQSESEASQAEPQEKQHSESRHELTGAFPSSPSSAAPSYSSVYQALVRLYDTYIPNQSARQLNLPSSMQVAMKGRLAEIKGEYERELAVLLAESVNARAAANSERGRAHRDAVSRTSSMTATLSQQMKTSDLPATIISPRAAHAAATMPMRQSLSVNVELPTAAAATGGNEAPLPNAITGPHAHAQNAGSRSPSASAALHKTPSFRLSLSPAVVDPALSPASVDFRLSCVSFFSSALSEVVGLISDNTWPRFLQSSELNACNKLNVWLGFYEELNAFDQQAVRLKIQQIRVKMRRKAMGKQGKENEKEQNIIE